MAIVVNKRPNERCWSGNPIHYALYSPAAAADSTIFFEIKIMFKRTDATDYSAIVTLPHNPVNGLARIDIKDILHGLLEYDVPALPDDNEYASPLFNSKQTGKFYIQWREITTADDDPDWVDTESANERFIIKGGISYEKWRGDNYWVNYFDPLKPFLTWQQSGKLASKNERMYLAWLNYTAINEGYIKMRRTVIFSDGTTQQTDLNFPATPNQVGYFPCGYNQLKLGDADPAKRVSFWELQVWDINAIVPLSELYRYELDNKFDRNDITINYRNSLGGFDDFRMTGVIEYHLQRSFEKVDVISLHNYFEGKFITPKERIVNSNESLIYKGDIGHLSKEEQDRLRDTHFKRESWWAQDGKWIPVNITTADQKLRDNLNKRWTFPIEFSIADGGDEYYTPKRINLAEGQLPNVNTCNAVISDPEAVEGVGGWTISWLLNSGAPAKYQISTPGVSGGAPYETNDTNYTFPWFPTGNNVITVRPVCLINGEYILGTPKTVNVNIAAACVGVGIVGAPALPDASAGDAYSYYFSLSGTAPFALDNIVKPAWMTITVTGNIIEFGGTPDTGDIANNIDVTFDITNCSGGNSTPFAGTLDVTAPPYNFYVINNAAGWMIDSASPAFYLINTGAFPLFTNEEIKGTHSGFTGPITIHVTDLGGGGAELFLKKNGVNVEIIPIATTHFYSFASIAFVTGDKIEVVLI